jgi:uncharacterized protein YycO
MTDTTIIYYRLIRDKGIISSFIAWWTWGTWTHAEFVTEKGLIGARLSGGVQVRPFNYCDPIQEEYRSIEVSNEQAKSLYSFLYSQIGKTYDWKAILGLGIRNNFANPKNSWFCSELVIAAFESINYTLLRTNYSYRITPRDLGLSIAGEILYNNPYKSSAYNYV